MTERKKDITHLFDGVTARWPKGAKKLTVTGIEYDSRKVKAGTLFVAVPGFKADGHDFVDMARQKGAVAAVVERKVAGVDLPQIVVPDARTALAKLAYNFYLPEIARVKLVGITGTNGKTTSALLMQSVIEAGGQRCGLIGTIAYEFGGQQVPAWNTTPEAPDICRMLFEMSQKDYAYCVLEVSSHGLALKRVEGLSFAAGLFTNLSRDHLDFHRSEEEYFNAKAHLFDLLARDGRAAVNIDDPYGQKLADRLGESAVTFGLSSRARVTATRWETRIDGVELEITTGRETWTVVSALTGFFNIYNILGVAATAVALGLPGSAVQKGIAAVKTVPGRLEMIPLNNGARVFIDYAHTPDALQKALQTLRGVAEGRLIVLFGAGGDRDRGKRPLMGKVAVELADEVFVTSDNPRSEDPDAIIADIVNGLNEHTNWRKITDRRQAIHQAVRSLQSGDVLLIAGKGHETYQEINGVKHPFDERQMVREAIDD